MYIINNIINIFVRMRNDRNVFRVIPIIYWNGVGVADVRQTFYKVNDLIVSYLFTNVAGDAI